MMSFSTSTWPCPACAELIPANYQCCPQCLLSPDWLDLLRALDFAVRSLLLWKLDGDIGAAQYQAVVDACRQQFDRLVRQAQAGQAPPADTGLPPRCACWSCGLTCHPSAHYCPDCSAPLDNPEVRLLRYQQFLVGEVQRHEQAGRLTQNDVQKLLTQVPDQLSQLRRRLDRARFVVSSR